MKTFIVKATAEVQIEMQIDAESEAQAKAIAQQLQYSTAENVTEVNRYWDYSTGVDGGKEITLDDPTDILWGLEIGFIDVESIVECDGYESGEEEDEIIRRLRGEE